MGGSLGSGLGAGQEKRESQVDGSTIQNIAYQYAPNWEWQGDDGIYVAYDAATALRLEKAHAKLQTEHHRVTVGSATVDVRAMVEESHGRRPVRRKTLDEAKRGLAEPSWVHQDEQVILADVDPGHVEASLVKSMFFGEGGLDGQEWGIVGVKRVQNQPLREAFHVEKQLMLRERGEEHLNEQLLVHGTRDLNPATIVEDRDGFMPEKGSERAFYGQGCYFAELVRYSHHYGYASNGGRQLLLVDALCGIELDMGDQLDRAGTKCNRAWLRSNGYDSVVGGPHTPKQKGRGQSESRLRVVYRPNQIYPRFLVTYKPIAARALLNPSRTAERKRTSPKNPTTPKTGPVVRVAPNDVKVSHYEQILAVAWVDEALCLATQHALHLDVHGNAQRLSLPHTGHCAAWSAAGRPAVALRNRRLLVDARDSAKAVEHPALIQALCWCGEDNLATGSKDGKVRMFAASTRSLRESFSHSCPVLSMAWCHQKLAVGGSDGKLCVLSLTTMTPERVVEFGNWLTSLAWNTDGETLAAGCDDGKLHVLTPGAEESVKHEDRVCSAMFHPEHRHIVATGAINGKIRIVNTMSGSAECVSRGEEVATSAAWSASGDALAVGFAGGTLRVFSFAKPGFGLERPR
ncbi:unnamed protein product [Effrenium voratum]|nr:unnamed protein product [Effrenium voratum]